MAVEVVVVMVVAVAAVVVVVGTRTHAELVPWVAAQHVDAADLALSCHG